MQVTSEQNERMAKMTFSSVFPHYLKKIEKKGRTKEELLKVIEWLTGYNKSQIQKHLESQTTFEDFFSEAKLHPNAPLIKGSICGYRIEDITYPLARNIRYLDKLVDDLAKGRKNVLL